jgi:serine/threonine protein phosphatase 1
MKYYVLADLHGMYNFLESALAKIDFADAEMRFIVTGDYIDRGPDSAKIIQKLMDLQKEHPEQVICLMGNHEAMMIETYDKPLAKDWWFGNGGYQTYVSYLGDPDVEHMSWLRKLPLYYETPKHVFVHAGIPDDRPLEEQNEERMIWMLYNKDDHGGWNGKHVVHGHHIHEDGPKEWNHRTNLDTGSFFTNRQFLGVFDDTQGRALEYIEL